MKRTIVIILIAATILSATGVFLFKPKPAKAFLGIGDIVADVLGWLKEFFLDRLPRIVARYAMVRIQQEITRWAQGGFTDENKPFAMFSWKEEITDALNLASAKFIEEFGLTPLCAPLRFTIGQRLGLAMPYYTIPPYQIYAACTLGTVVDNVEEFFENPSITLYGWDTWTALSQPQNNIYGAALLAAERLAELQSEEKAEKELQKDTGGYENENQCLNYQEMTDEEMQDCVSDCTDSTTLTGKNCGCRSGVPYSCNSSCVEACIATCQNKQTGICLEYKTKNLGSTIHSAIEKAVGSDIDWLISADEITQMFDLVFSKFFNKLIHGSGLTNQPIYRASQTISKYQAQYGYQQNYQKVRTPEDIKDTRKDILENILSAVKGATTTNYECNNDYQVTGDTYSEIATEIIDEEAQHLYTAIEGVNLKPDFQVLDLPWAPSNLFLLGKTLGVTWDEITFANYPEECQKITGTTCRNIITNLPYELDLNNINSECTTGCLGRVNYYRGQCESTAQTCVDNCNGDQNCINNCYNTQATCYNDAITNAVNDGYCSSAAIATACQQGEELIGVTQARCDECVKKAQETCENESDQASRDACIDIACSNYLDYTSLASQIIDAQDFYNKCKRNELKNMCNACLKEYFMPGFYCEIIYDFVNRAFVKYPALAYADMWWGRYNEQSNCGSNTRGRQIETGLLCRILPNNPICQTACNATAEELKDIYDDEPNSDDCNPYQTVTGAYSPGGQYLGYLWKKKAKCCVALSSGRVDVYTACRGEVAVETRQCTGLPPMWEPWCHCPEGWRPILNGRIRTGGLWANSTSPGGDCDFGVISTLNDNRMLLVYTGGGPNSETYFIGTDTCGETDPAVNNTDKEDTNPNDGYVDGNGVPDGDPTDAIPPNNMLWNAVPGGDPAAQGRLNSESWCVDPNAQGMIRGTDYYTGVFHNGWEDTGSSSIMVCAPCSSSDSDYPYYGIRDGNGNLNDQCHGKIPETLWINDCGQGQ